MVLLVVLVVALGLVVLLISLRSNLNDRSTENTDEYLDPHSGETVSNPPGKSPEVYGTDESQPVYLGFSKLLNVGITALQIEVLKDSIDTFAQQEYGKHASEVSIDVSTITQSEFDRDSEDTSRYVAFDVIIDRGDRFQATFYQTSLRGGKLTLHKANSLVFDSGDIEAELHGD